MTTARGGLKVSSSSGRVRVSKTVTRLVWPRSSINGSFSGVRINLQWRTRSHPWLHCRAPRSQSTECLHWLTQHIMAILLNLTGTEEPRCSTMHICCFVWATKWRVQGSNRSQTGVETLQNRLYTTQDGNLLLWHDSQHHISTRTCLPRLLTFLSRCSAVVAEKTFKTSLCRQPVSAGAS